MSKEERLTGKDGTVLFNIEPVLRSKNQWDRAEREVKDSPAESYPQRKPKAHRFGSQEIYIAIRLTCCFRVRAVGDLRKGLIRDTRIIFTRLSRSSSDLTFHRIRWLVFVPFSSPACIISPTKPAFSLSSYHLFSRPALRLSITLPLVSWKKNMTARIIRPQVITWT